MLFCGFAVLSGCSQKLPANFPKTVPCKITVTNGGVPLDTATVILTATDGSGGNWVVAGETNTQGVAEIKTVTLGHSADGAPAGLFKVTVRKPLPLYIDSTPKEQLEKMDYEQTLAHNAKIGEEANKRPPIVPEKYSDPAQTTLTIEVKPDTPAEATFEVEK
jgi:hypothetical protein